MMEQLQQQQPTQGQPPHEQALLQKLYVENRGDLEKTVKDFVSAGGSPQAAESLRAAEADRRQQVAGMTEKEFEIYKVKTEMLAEALLFVLSVPEPFRKKAYDQASERLVQDGILEQVPPYQGTDQIKLLSTMEIAALNHIEVVEKERHHRKFEIISPAPESCYPTIWRLLKEEFAEQTIDALAPTTLEECIERARREAEVGGRSYAILKDGVVVGAVWCEPLVDSMCLGHLVFERKALSSTEKMRVSRQAVEKIFADGFRKIVWIFFSDNRAFRVFLKRLGAKHEGVLRKQWRRNGELVDAEIMASFPAEVG